MAKTTINNGGSGSDIRTALNNMFTELYAGETRVQLATGTGAAAANTTALQAALDVTGEVFIAGTGTFYVNASLVISSNTHLRGAPGLILRAATGMNAAVLINEGRDVLGSSSIVPGNYAGDENITVSDIIFDGDKANQTVAFSTVDFCKAIRNINFTRCGFRGALRTGTFPTVSSHGEGLVLRYCEQVKVTDCEASDNSYDGFKTRASTHCQFTGCSGEENGRAGIQLSYQDSAANLSQYITVNGFTYSHSTGTPSASAPTTSGIYLHTACDCTLSNLAITGVRQGVAVYEGSNDNLFTNMRLATRYVDKAVVDVEVGPTSCSRNIFSNIHIRPLSGANGIYLRVNGNGAGATSGSYNRFSNVWASFGAGSGTWTVQILGAGSARNQISDALFANYSLTDTGTTTGFDNLISF